MTTKMFFHYAIGVIVLKDQENYVYARTKIIYKQPKNILHRHLVGGSQLIPKHHKKSYGDLNEIFLFTLMN